MCSALASLLQHAQFDTQTTNESGTIPSPPLYSQRGRSLSPSLARTHNLEIDILEMDQMHPDSLTPIVFFHPTLQMACSLPLSLSSSVLIFNALFIGNLYWQWFHLLKMSSPVCLNWISLVFFHYTPWVRPDFPPLCSFLLQSLTSACDPWPLKCT